MACDCSDVCCTGERLQTLFGELPLFSFGAERPHREEENCGLEASQ